MELCYNYDSFARKLVVGIAMMMIALVGYAYCGQPCGPTMPDLPAGGPCSDNWYLCVDNLISILRDKTPDTGFFHSDSYPYNSTGAVTGSASCAQGTDLDQCNLCLSIANTSLDDCKSYATGSYDVQLCTMWFGQIS